MSQDDCIKWDDDFKYKLLSFLKGWDLTEKQLESIEKVLELCMARKLEACKDEFREEIQMLRSALVKMKSHNDEMDQKQNLAIRTLKNSMDNDKANRAEKDKNFKVGVGWALAILTIIISLVGLFK